MLRRSIEFWRLGCAETYNEIEDSLGGDFLGYTKMLGFRSLCLLFILHGPIATIAEINDASALLVGNWYGEMVCDCGKWDFLRWTRLNTADGVQRVHGQYYKDGKVLEDVVRLGHWGYRDGKYWLTCESYHVNGKARSCPYAFYEFVVDSIDAEGMAYHSETQGIRYKTRRVSDDFQLDNR